MKLSNVTIECFRKKSTIGESFLFITMYKIDNAFAVLEANYSNYSLVWIFTRKIHMMLPSSMDFARVKLSL